jgi:hypothetical protein
MHFRKAEYGNEPARCKSSSINGKFEKHVKPQQTGVLF